MEDFRSPLLAALAIWGIAGWPTAPVAAQENSSRIRFTTLSKSTLGGLKSDQVRDLTQDLGGYVWLATDRGLCRFDGWETVEYLHDPNSPNSLSSDQLTAVATTQGVAGPLWIGTSSSGLMRFDQRTGKSIFLRKGGPHSPQLLSDHIAKLAVSNDQYLWIGTDQGLNVLNLATETMVVADGPLGSANISAICPLEKGGLWVGTEAGELHHWNIAEKRFERFWSTSVPITAVAADPKNTTWIATAGMGLFSYSPDHDKAPVPHPGLGKSTVTSLFLDSNGNLWIGTTEGLALYDQGNDSFVLFQHMPREADSLAADQITAIFEDRSRILWIATRTGGPSRFNLDRQWFAHIRHHPDRPERLPHASVRTVAIGHDGNVWLGTEEGLAVWDDASGKFRPAPDLGGSAKTSFNHIGFDREGRLWMGTRGAGLLMRDPAGTLHEYRHDPAQPGSIGHDNVSAVIQDAGGRIFVGTLGDGLFRLDVSTGAFSRIASDSSRELSFVSSLAEDAGGAIWVASQDEILILPAGGERLQPMRSVYPKAAPTSSDRPSTIFADTNGIVWIGTVDAGLDRF
ncbi:MAG TPA: two-component regulator propeller domain-containing protein, partial [Bacteroidia bacterium]|nr:two-component regulator propeller domain-containing protein [Bacteroidia bacterium]